MKSPALSRVNRHKIQRYKMMQSFALLIFLIFTKFSSFSKGFPGGAVVKNPPANAGDTGSSPGP